MVFEILGRIWRVTDQQAGTVTYRVGVGLYGSATGEFADCHFTDDVHDCGNFALFGVNE
jgi:hypothetical protein